MYACVDIQDIKSLFSLFGYWGSNLGSFLPTQPSLQSPSYSPPPFLSFILCVWIFSLNLFPMLAWCQQRSEESIGSPRIRIRGGCEAPCKWELKLHPLQEQFLLSHLIWDPKENDLLKYVWWKIWKLYSTGKQKSSF